MLQQMRRFASSWVASIFLGALAFSFAIWGIADIFRGGGNTSIATVGGEKIPPEAYQQEYQNIQRSAQNRLGQPITSEMAKRLGLAQHALDELIDDTALNQVAQKFGLLTTDQQVAAYVHAIPQFNGPLGTFDHNTFLEALQRSGFTEQSFIDVVRTNGMRDQLAAAARNGVILPEGYTHALLSYLNERRVVDYVTVPASAAGAPTPDDATLAAYVKQHPERYSTPEYRDVTYATVGPEDVMSQVTVSDQQLRQEYDARKNTPQYAYEVPDRRDVEEITFPDQASAAAARAKIAAGMSFSDLAKSRGVAPINLGAVALADLGDRGSAVFALPPDGVTQPLKGLSDWELLHVTKITPGVHKSFDDVKADIRKDLMQQIAAAKVQDMANAYTDANSGGASLAEAAKRVGMKVVHVAAVDSNGLAPDGSHADVPADPGFLQQVFRADVGVEGDPFTNKTGRAFVVVVNGQTPPHLKTLDQVRAQATTAWQQEEMQRRLADKAKTLTAQANDAHDVSVAAKALGDTPKTSGALMRPTPTEPGPSGFTPQLLLAIFAAPPGSVVYGPDTKGGYVIAKITGVQHPPLPIFDPRYRQFQNDIARRAGEDLDDSLAAAARTQQGVSVNKDVAARMIGGS